MRARGWGLGGFVTGIAAVIAALLGTYVIAVGITSYKTATVARRWQRALGSRDAIFSRFPPTDANAHALALEPLSAALGITLSPRWSDAARARATTEQARAFGAARTALSPWLSSQLERSSRALDPPPADAMRFLEAAASELGAVRDYLARGDVPRWETDLSRHYAATLPNLQGHINLVKLLLGDALIRTRVGDHETARRDLDAAWTLIRSERESPLLICQLIVVAEARLLAGTLRHVPDLPAVWRARLDPGGFRDAVIEALKLEAWHWTRIDDVRDAVDLPAATSRLLGGVTKPYLRYCVADISDDVRARLVNLERVSSLCDYDLARHDADLELPVPDWNVMGKLMAPDLTNAVNRVARLELDLELTSRLLQLEAACRDTGKWPAALPGGERSEACPQDRWIYEVAADGSMRLALSREPSWPRGAGAQQPAYFQLRCLP